MLLDSKVHKRFRVVFAMLFCFVLMAMAQAQVADSCKQSATEPPREEPSQKVAEQKPSQTEEKRSTDKTKKRNSDANIESIFLFKHHAISKL